MPHWAFRALTAFSLHPLRILDVSRTENDNNSKPSSADMTSDIPRINLNRPELQDGLATPPLEPEQTPPSWSCLCGNQQIDFCPYCEYDQIQETSVIQSTVPLPKPEVDFSSTPDVKPAPRKLRKTRSDYHQLRYEALDATDILSARPDSILSSHSRTPLLDTRPLVNTNYLPLPAERRPRNKLEKRKYARATSDMDGYTPMGSSINMLRAKTVMSKSFLHPQMKDMRGPRPKLVPSSIDTDALVSLAWTGEASSTSPMKSSELLLSSPSRSTILSNLDSRSDSLTNADLYEAALGSLSGSLASPAVIKKRAVLQKAREPDNNVASQSRPWTLAMAITDDGISDEKLVTELEDMRIKGTLLESGTSLFPLGLGPPPSYETQLYDSYAEYPLQADELQAVKEIQQDIFPADSSWTAARQVLLLCRELVRTERRYLVSLKMLITNGTNSPPPSSMLPYLPGLIMASDDLLQLMEANPSAQGVSDAFLACEDKLKEAFTNWCGIVGDFFNSGEKSKIKTESGDLSRVSSTGDLLSQRSQPIMSRTDSSLSIVIPEPNKIRKNIKSRPAVRDLAILPTQRIMRYVLLFKELYSLTPPLLSSFDIVEKAYQAAQTIAEMANEAQGHAAFEQPLYFRSRSSS